ncbi:MAG: hypothetical protein FWC06_04700 [Treponema sp.]|nr:hypothetical protein [Treponema sp.]
MPCICKRVRVRAQFLSLLILFFSCGIEEYYYLPQIPQSNISYNFDTEATINIPSVNMTEFYYFTNYSIYYRIYISETPVNISSTASYTSDLRNDYNAIAPYADPTNTSAATSIDQVFRNRNYHELQFEEESIGSILQSGSLLRIIFPTALGDYPYASATLSGNTKSADLNRSIRDPAPNRFFINSPELGTNERNSDVSRRSGSYAYVSMYIVAKGNDNANFREILSKPTHINIFRLPDES